ncbi:SDR family NAD(P)-dependent oxidoreductase [Planomicrobium sp. YIM 101495]|uniref:SDR family NAD(P)-dependent oxidoreductase n=1 Tax=Planomicrobium sp. YIM 101495 TaxID=2665160 RepID=UPI0012B6EFBC|nr:SDR family NAD(P)-dependent oxidoreductase [Planomicrobium sp. YIM 101495]MTD31269.1 SDR family NAD(P)-dependent oxidoreductase [Planomicrobium sp. YIM 101495]
MQRYRLLESILFVPAPFSAAKLAQELRGKTILITGASSGIGKELAYLLKDAEVHLILVARRAGLLEEIKVNLELGSASVSIIPADLRNEEERAGLFEFLHALPDGLDILINNAGLSINRPVMQSLDRFHDVTRTAAINYFAPVDLVLSLAPLLEQKGGHIVNVSTVNAVLVPVPHWAAYEASKGAFDTWLRAALPELHARGIAVSTLYLPLVRTPMIEPTAAYREVPAMSPVHVAELIGKLFVTRKKTYKPWWLFPGEVGSVLFRGPIETVLTRRLMKQERRRKDG